MVERLSLISAHGLIAWDYKKIKKTNRQYLGSEECELRDCFLQGLQYLLIK